MVYPEKHKQIVEDLMNGRFILSRENHFEELKKNEEDFYTPFFQKSFGYKLILKQEYLFGFRGHRRKHFKRHKHFLWGFLLRVRQTGKEFS